MEDEEAVRSRSDKSPYFIVELEKPGSGFLVLCKRVQTSDNSDSIGGLPREAVSDLFERAPLRAVALPNSSNVPRSHLSKAIEPQLFTVNININGSPGDGRE
ncbi:hypothetical protein U1701_17900 [Sphingomonas sp. PB2P19]|uniref:hypothetical protein n=1 Tax=Sphingomonas rhamnosi TaxID=3096156 RepID=UPI002FC6192B